MSVIIPSYNQGPYIERTLRSILGQGYPGPVEVIVSDGGSTDGTVAVLKRYPQVRWWSERDRGFADAVNKGLAAATGEIVAIQSSDDFYLPGALARAAAALRDDPAIDFVTGNEVRVEEDGQLAYPPVLPFVTLANPGALIGRTPVFNIPQHCTFARRSAVERIGGLREAVDYCADFDLWYRLLHFGRALVLPAYLGVCQIHVGQRTQSKADLWIASLTKVVEDAESDPVYTSRFVPTPQMKRDIFLQWEVLWNIAAGGPEGVRAGRLLARQALEQPQGWPDYVLDFVKTYGSEPPEAESPDAEAALGTPAANEPFFVPEMPYEPAMDGFQPIRRLLRNIKQVPLLRAAFGKAPFTPQSGTTDSEAAEGVPVLTRLDTLPEVVTGGINTEAIDATWWMEPFNEQQTDGVRLPPALGNLMLEEQKEKRTGEWNRYIQERVEGPLRPQGFLVPEKTQSALIIVPGSSGDVVLATTLVRYVKNRNPECRVSFAVKKSNLPLIQLCPGVDEVFEWPRETKTNPRSRRLSLTKYADRADVVVYPICDPEDMDLLLRYNFLETLWLLAGVPDGMPLDPQRLWLRPLNDPAAALQFLERCLSHKFAAQLVAEVSRQPAKIIGEAVRLRKFKNIGWKAAPVASINLLRHAALVKKLAGQIDLLDVARKFVIISNEANMFPPPAKGIFEKIVRFFRDQGRIVLQNVLDPAKTLPGAVPLVCSYHEFLGLRELGIPFVGWRSGLCDIAAASAAPMCVVYPDTFKGCGDLIQANMENPIASFGFKAMNIEADVSEFVCDRAADLDLDKLAALIH